MNKVLGIIAEYNPLHLGHYHQLQTAARETGCEYIVIAMSGNYVQRGEPAIFDKWIRSKMALTAGADLVLEIPTYFVLQSAEGFARAGVALLSCCGISHLSFGSESGNISNLANLAQWLERTETQLSIRKALQTGITYAAAVQSAVEDSPDTALLAPLLNGANNILAIEYLRAINEFAPGTSIHTVKRIGNPETGYSSASDLRKLLAAGRILEVRNYIPSCSVSVFDQAIETAGPVFAHDFTQAVFYALSILDSQEISTLPACSEGLENRIINALGNHRDLVGLLGAVKTKRYPFTRIQRLLMQALLQFQNVGYACTPAPYLRVLACSSRGKSLLSTLTSLNKAPLLFSARDFKRLDESAKTLLNLDLKAADIYNLTLDATDAKRDILQMPETNDH